MEDQKNKEAKNEDACCSHSEKMSGCCGFKHGGIRVLIKIAIILVIFLAGICVGAGVSRHEKGYSEGCSLGKNSRGQGGCPMMSGGDKGCALQDKSVVPAGGCAMQNKLITPDTATSTK